MNGLCFTPEFYSSPRLKGWVFGPRIKKIMNILYYKSPSLLQTLLLNAHAFNLYRRRYNNKFWKLSDEFNKNERLSEHEIREYQDEKLRCLIKHAYENVPLYKERMQNSKLFPEDIKGQNDLFKLPILTREDIKNNFQKLKAINYPEKKLFLGHTSGTTGSPLEFYWDNSVEVLHHVADWRQKKWAGLEFGDRYASLQGRVIVPIKKKNPPFWKTNYLNNQLFLSSFHLEKENIRYYIDKIISFKPLAIEGYPSTLFILAKYLLSIKTSVPLKAVLTSSETLFPIQREAIEAAFQCKVFDFYGMAERVIYASECECHEGHHLNFDYSITELLDGNNEPVSVGKIGRIVATGLWNYGMPLIRYKTSDASALKSNKCSCGRVFPLMQDVTTKDEDIVTTPDGRLISSSVLTHPFKPMHNIEESQIIQEDLRSITIKIVKKEMYSEKDSLKLTKALKERLGDGVNINLEFVESIPRTRNGKFRWVISKVPLEF